MVEDKRWAVLQRTLFIFVTFLCRPLTFLFIFHFTFVSLFSFCSFCCSTIHNFFTTIASLSFSHTAGLSPYFLFYHPIVNAFHWYVRQRAAVVWPKRDDAKEIYVKLSQLNKMPRLRHVVRTKSKLRPSMQFSPCPWMRRRANGA